ncbi:TonB-dependent receptor domain-containing protein [Hymenobacter nivis]|uniref:TonB-dependent receptor domain-containing protein n=1 Tax=Hymenobacter nivis TaxID=1850093 RepID=UPI00147769CF|nr:TonB-dependent receptor [Hymenobacter nivis]
MQPRILPSTLLLATALVGTISSGHGQQAPARPALPGAPTRVAGRLTGTVTDGANGKPVSYASVAVLDAAGTPVNGGVCGDDGKFVLPGIPPGTYTIKVSFLGYQDITRPGVVVPAAGGVVALGTLPMTAAAQKLGEVVVVAQKPLIEEKVDRTVYNAENDQTTRGGDATDVMKRVPLLSVDLDGNVSLRGSSNIRVLINNKPSTIAANSIADALKQIPADQIKSVEVITSPSAKYDAEGSGGIINIVTKQNNLRGGQLGVDASVGTRSANLGLNGSYRTGKMGFSLGGFGRAGYNTPGSFSNDQLITNVDPTNGTRNQTRTTQAADTRQNQLFGRYTFGWDYDIDKHNSLAASVSYGTRNATNYQDALATNTALVTSSGAPTTSTRNVKTTDESGTVDASLNYTHTYEVEQRELSVLTLFSRNNRTYNFNNDIYAASDASRTGISGNDNLSSNQELTAQIDYQTPTVKNQLLELGVKDIKRTVNSDYSYYGQLTQPNNSFNYNQNVASGYVAYTMSLPKGFTLKPGVRYEYTTISADFGQGAVGNIPNYGVLVPSVNLSRKLANGNVLKLAYNRRIQRPSLQFLNPNVQASNPLIQTQGNPELSPEYTNNYEVGYSTALKGANLNFSGFVRNTTGSIQSVRTPITDAPTVNTPLGLTYFPGAVYITYQNIGNEDAYGGSVFVSKNSGSKFSVNGGVDGYYAVLNNGITDVDRAAKNEGFVVSGRLFGSYALTKVWGLQAFAFYRGRQVQLQGFQSGFGIYSLSVKRDFAEKRGSFGIGAENFFTSGINIRNEITSPLLVQNSTNVLHNMSFKVNISYRIGKLTVDQRPRNRKGVNNDDLKEGGDNGGGGLGGDTGAQGGGGGQGGGGARQGGGRPAGAPGARPATAAPRADTTRTAPAVVPAGGAVQPDGTVAPAATPALIPGAGTPTGLPAAPDPANAPVPATTTPADSSKTKPATPAQKTTVPVGTPSPGTTSPGGITPAGSPGGRP